MYIPRIRRMMHNIHHSECSLFMRETKHVCDFQMAKNTACGVYFLLDFTSSYAPVFGSDGTNRCTCFWLLLSFILAAATQAQMLPFAMAVTQHCLPLKSLLIEFFVPWEYLNNALSTVFVSQPAISDPDELGSSLATQCFSQAQLSIDAKLGIDGEF